MFEGAIWLTVFSTRATWLQLVISMEKSGMPVTENKTG